MAVLSALVALEGARRARLAATGAAEEATAAGQQADSARRQAVAAAQQAAVAERQARAVAESVEVAREHVAVARQQAGNVGDVDVTWVQQFRHGPVFGLLRVQPAGHHPLHDVHLSIVAPRHQVGGVPAVAVLGDTPVDISTAEERIGLPDSSQVTLPNVVRTDVQVGELRPGVEWHVLLMCLSEADAIVFIMDWSVGPARDRERARKLVALPPPVRSSDPS